MRLGTIVRAVAATAILATLAAGAGPAGAALESCSYDAVSKRVTAEITSGAQATLKVKASGELWFGLVPAPCGGATTANTDLVVVGGGTGTIEGLTVDQSEGFIGPGYSAESNLPEIELEVNLGDAADGFSVVGTTGDDRMAAGLSGFSFNSDGDLDVTFSPLPAHMTMVGGGGSDFITSRGGWGAGLAYPGSSSITGGSGADELNGGNGSDTILGAGGNDVINGYGAADHLEGGSGDDRLSGGDGNDVIVGGPGADDMLGGYDADTITANDGEADVQIHGGPGTDSATVDRVDPATIAVENKTVDPGPPPPPPPPGGTCTYNAATREVTAGLPAGEQATLAVVGGAIHFGLVPSACGAATTANTDSITVDGVAGSVERLVIDQSGGALAPGATPEASGTSEIEIAVNLRDASDQVVVHGTAGNDTLAAGTNGLALNADSDVDVTFAVSPASLELLGGGGTNLLRARGGYGTGQVFPGRVTLRAGDGGDILEGSNLDDLLVGGAGADTIDGASGNDELHGEAGNDTLTGSHGNDLLVGGAGADTLSAGAGDDTIDAVDGAADFQIFGQQGFDTARYDAGVDPAPVAVENLVPVP